MACALGFAQNARAADCAGSGQPGAAAGTAALYGTLASSIAAEPLAVAIAQRASGGTCAWVYEVRVLTSRGNVAVLDFDIHDLDLTRVEGPATDPDIAALFERLERGGGSREPGEATAGGEGSAAGSDGGDGDGGGGEGGDSGGGNSGSDGGGGEGGNSGSDGGGGDSGGGEGGDGGGDGGGGEGGDGGGGGGEGGEGGNDD
ncbi:hypothetical protein [Dongia mobilis]|uniref:hypothetical protein n=1 Tax=Dongia mobilis TaxID=578943 RepID=UPI001AAD78AC|nr:hypothetical protein [Dongia mobilis]